jgi:hypothetical protein
MFREPGSPVSIVTSYGLGSNVVSPTEAEDFSTNLCVQAGSGAHPASFTVGTGGSFPGNKARPGRDADHSPPSSVVVKKEKGYPPPPPQSAFMACSGSTPLSIGRPTELGTQHATAAFCVVTSSFPGSEIAVLSARCHELSFLVNY